MMMMMMVMVMMMMMMMMMMYTRCEMTVARFAVPGTGQQQPELRVQGTRQSSQTGDAAL